MKREIILAMIVIFVGTAVALLPSYATMTGQVTVSDACGSGRVMDEEQCELPGTTNNQYCPQATSECENGVGPKTRTRDAFGSCNSVCSCVEDTFSPFACLKDSCGAACDSNNDCPASQCSATFNDICVGPKLQEFDNDKILDSTLVQNSVANTCDVQNTCGCSNNPVQCNAPPTNTYCVQGVCGATCDDNSDCSPTACDQLDGCFEGTFRDYTDQTNTCDTENTCGCTQNQCTSFVPVITDNDQDGYDTQCDLDCNDNDPTINPGATEICDGIDNNCNGQIDENLGSTTCGVGLCEVTINNCVGGEPQTCTPGSPPETIETTCNDGLDNDCDGLTDLADPNCVS